MAFRTLGGLAVAGLMVLGAGANAQEADEELEIIDLIEVVGEAGYRATSANSATGLNVPLGEIPVNIQVITADVVSDFQLLSQRDALQFHAATDDKRVRGFNSGEFFRNGFIHLSDVHGYTIERLEIIRGPSAVLNGPVTPGGAINIITKSPTIDENFGEIGGYWGFSGSDRDNRGINVDFNMGDMGIGSMDGPTAAFRFVGGFQEDTGFGTRVNNESHTILPMLELRPTENTVVNLEYYQYQINSDRTDRPMGIELTIPGDTPGEEVPIALAYGIDPRTSWFGEDTDINESLNDYSISIAHQFSDTVLANVEYNNHSRDFVFGPGNRPRIDIFYRMEADPLAPEGSPDPNDYQLRRLTENLSLYNDIDQATASIAFLPGGTGDHQIVAGFHLYDQNAHLTIQRPRLSGTTSGFFFDYFDPFTAATDTFEFNQTGDDVFFVTVLDRLENIDQTNYFVNYFGKFMNDRLSVLLGLTQSDISIERADPRVSPVTFTSIADNSETLPQAGFVFDFTDSFGIYANYSESQLPDVNDPDFSTAPPVRIGEQFEFGVKFSLLDGLIDGSAGVFTIDEDLSGETTRSAEVDGFEIDAAIAPSDFWSVIFSYASADSEVKASTGSSVVGDPLVDEIPQKAAIWSVYDFEEGGMSGLSIGGGFIWTSERPRPTAPVAQSIKKLDGVILEYDAETRLDLFARYRWDRHEVSLNLRNITEEVNMSNNVPRVPLQGGVKPDGSPYVFDGDMEVMLGYRFRY